MTSIRLAAAVAALAVAVAALPAAANAASTPSYYPYGPQQNVSRAAVAAGGWKVCYTSTFAQDWQYLGNIDNACTGDELMLATGVASAPDHWALLAAAPRDTVVNYTTGYNDPATLNATVNANGSEWYRGTHSSWGFAPEGVSTDHVWDQCDLNEDQAALHMCWNTWADTLTFGGRVGTTWVNMADPAGADYQRAVLEPSHVSATASPDALTFGSQPLSTVSAKQTVTFTVSTDVPGLTDQERALGKLQVTGAGADDYDVVDNDCPAVAPDNASVTCTVKLRFVPQASGARQAALGFAAFGSTVTLAGTGGQLPQGPAGNDGSTGNDGATGPQGPAGIDGANGTNGRDGKDGTNGRDGKDGAQGPAGKDGNNGTDGLNGKNGMNGRDGKKGAAGPRGRSGHTTGVACKVTRHRAGSRVNCTFTKRMSKLARVALHDGRGQIAAAHGTGTHRMVFITARPVHGKLTVWVVNRS